MARKQNMLLIWQKFTKSDPLREPYWEIDGQINGQQYHGRSGLDPRTDTIWLIVYDKSGDFIRNDDGSAKIFFKSAYHPRRQFIDVHSHFIEAFFQETIEKLIKNGELYF